MRYFRRLPRPSQIVLDPNIHQVSWTMPWSWRDFRRESKSTRLCVCGGITTIPALRWPDFKATFGAISNTIENIERPDQIRPAASFFDTRWSHVAGQKKEGASRPLFKLPGAPGPPLDPENPPCRPAAVRDLARGPSRSCWMRSKFGRARFWGGGSSAEGEPQGFLVRLPRRDSGPGQWGDPEFCG